MPSLLSGRKDRRRQRRNSDQLRAITQQRAVSMCLELENRLLTNNQPGVGNDITPELIVSLASYSKRIDNVYLTIESLMRQTLKPSRIILNLDANEFSAETVPLSIKKQQERGLEIIFYPKDIGPYKKYLLALKNNPDSLIITVDDDVMYPIDLVAQLYDAYRKEPNVIHCQRAHRIIANNQGKPLPYKQWDFGTDYTGASLDVFPTGVGGVLYFPGCFDDNVFNQELFMKLAPNADDIWLKAMSLKRGVPCKKVVDPRDWGTRFPTIPGSQAESLKRINKQKKGGNNDKILSVFEYFDLLPIAASD